MYVIDLTIYRISILAVKKIVELLSKVPPLSVVFAHRNVSPVHVMRNPDAKHSRSTHWCLCCKASYVLVLTAMYPNTNNPPARFLVSVNYCFLVCVCVCVCLCVCVCAVPVFGYEIGVWTIVAVLSFPISFLKQCVSVVQLVVACQNIGGLDVIKRARRSTDAD